MAVFGVALTKYYYQGIANTFQNHVKAVDPFCEKGNELHYGGIEDYSDLVIKNYQYGGAGIAVIECGWRTYTIVHRLLRRTKLPIRS